MQQQKFITSHKERVARAKRLIDQLPEKISIFDREAFVEFFLLEDIERLYRYRYDKVKSKDKITPEGRFFQKKQLEKIHYLIYMLDRCIEVMEGKIDDGAYSDVWKAIHEHQLMVAAGNLKYLDKLVEMTEGMLRDVDNEALVLAQKMLDAEEFMNDLEAHDANVRRLKGIPEYQEINDVIDPADAAKSQRRTTKYKADLN